MKKKPALRTLLAVLGLALVIAVYVVTSHIGRNKVTPQASLSQEATVEPTEMPSASPTSSLDADI